MIVSESAAHSFQIWPHSFHIIVSKSAVIVSKSAVIVSKSRGDQNWLVKYFRFHIDFLSNQPKFFSRSDCFTPQLSTFPQSLKATSSLSPSFGRLERFVGRLGQGKDMEICVHILYFFGVILYFADVIQSHPSKSNTPTWPLKMNRSNTQLGLLRGYLIVGTKMGEGITHCIHTHHMKAWSISCLWPGTTGTTATASCFLTGSFSFEGPCIFFVNLLFWPL